MNSAKVELNKSSANRVTNLTDNEITTIYGGVVATGTGLQTDARVAGTGTGTGTGAEIDVTGTGTGLN